MALSTQAEVRAYRATKPHLCGFCETGTHERCPRAVRNGVNAQYKIITCDCRAEGLNCGDSILRCLECKSEAQEDIDPDNWRCFDPDGCKARIQARMDANPAYQKILESRRNTMARLANEKAEKKASPAKASKTGTCICGCNGTTKGGNFLPGHDARYVSLRVGGVLEGKQTAAQARKTLKDDAVSDKLVAKFERSLEVQTEKAAKKEAAAKEKAAAKKEKAAASK